MKNLSKIFGINLSKPNGETDAANNTRNDIKNSAKDNADADADTSENLLEESYLLDSLYAKNNISLPNDFEITLSDFKLSKDEPTASRKVTSSIISPNPFQPRKSFNEEALQELAASIREHGIIQPLIVRQKGDTYQLVAGERRLKASKIAGLSEVPIIVRDLTDEEMAELALIENLQREDLHFLEEAEGFLSLISNFSLTQEALAKRMGKSQSAIANKLRLLKLSDQVRKEILKQKLTERHTRALLRLSDEKVQLKVLEIVAQKRLNVRQTEEFIENYLKDISRENQQLKSPKQKVTKIIKDVRIFINTINTITSQMKNNGMDIDYKQEFDGKYVKIIMQIKNNKNT